jgi:hypothetical protein
MSLLQKLSCFALIPWLAFIIPLQVEAKTMFVGFKKADKACKIPEEWKEITYFRTRKNKMSLSKDGVRTVLEVKSMGSASAIMKRLNVDLSSFPILVWRWKINSVLGMAIENRRDRNDSAARIRVISGDRQTKTPIKPPGISKLFEKFGFQLGEFEPKGMKIDYIWGNTMPKGKVIDYPKATNHKIVIIESGNKKANKWVWEKRNIAEDFRKFFGSSPSNLTGIVVLTDTDQTNNGVIAWYSSIIMMSE